MNSSQTNRQYGDAHVIVQLPAYLNNTLDIQERERIDAYLLQCAACRTELAAWQAVAAATHETFAMTTAAPSAAAIDAIWARIDQTAWERTVEIVGSLRRRAIFAGQVARAQTRLIPTGIWALSAAALLLSFTGMLFWRIGAYPHAILGAFVPLITAVGMAFIYGPEYDESLEVTRSTPVSPRLILLSRVALVFVFNFTLGLMMTLALMVLHGEDFSVLVAYWAGPTLLLAGLSLLLSLTISSLTGVVCIGVLWLVRFLGAAFSLPDTMLTSGSGPLAEIGEQAR